jgi:hypothetical protein
VAGCGSTAMAVGGQLGSQLGYPGHPANPPEYGRLAGWSLATVEMRWPSRERGTEWPDGIPLQLIPGLPGRALIFPSGPDAAPAEDSELWRVY